MGVRPPGYTISTSDAGEYAQPRVLKWVDGVPLPAQDVGRVTKDNVPSVIEALGSLYYSPKMHLDADGNPLYPKLEGMTLLEVALYFQMIRAAGGDKASLDFLLDRMVGKPKQMSETVTTNLTYEDWCAEMAKKETEMIDITPDPTGDTEE